MKLATEFWSNVRPSDGDGTLPREGECWAWAGSGRQVWWRGYPTRPRRIAWDLLRTALGSSDPIPPPNCGNASCINPFHADYDEPEPERDLRTVRGLLCSSCGRNRDSNGSGICDECLEVREAVRAHRTGGVKLTPRERIVPAGLTILTPLGSG